jgi:hypothetical protein
MEVPPPAISRIAPHKTSLSVGELLILFMGPWHGHLRETLQFKAISLKQALEFPALKILGALFLLM